jgi:hypothetical protein
MKDVGYETRFKNHLLSHLNKKNTCKPLLSDKPVHEKIKKPKLTNHKCKKCLKSFATNSYRLRHEKICKENDNNIAQTFEQTSNWVTHMQNEIHTLREATKTENASLRLELQY